MPKLLVLSLLLVFSTPVFAKPASVPCSELWAAVTDTLSDHGNYTINAIDDAQMKASFVVVGSLFRAVNSLYLKDKGHGCDLEVRMGFTGNEDESALRSRVRRAVAKRMAAKPTTTVSPGGAGG